MVAAAALMRVVVVAAAAVVDRMIGDLVNELKFCETLP